MHSTCFFWIDQNIMQSRGTVDDHRSNCSSHNNKINDHSIRWVWGKDCTSRKNTSYNSILIPLLTWARNWLPVSASNSLFHKCHTSASTCQIVIDKISVKNLVCAKNDVFNMINMSEKRAISMKNLRYLTPEGYCLINSW